MRIIDTAKLHTKEQLLKARRFKNRSKRMARIIGGGCLVFGAFGLLLPFISGFALIALGLFLMMEDDKLKW